MKQSAENWQAIFVLAGRGSRKQYALTLNKNRLDRILLLSVARFEIRKLSSFGLSMPFDLVSRAALLQPLERHFFLTVHGNRVADVHYVPAHRLGTLREIMALGAWLEMHPQLQSLIIVSSGFHLPRVRLCCRALLPKRVQVKFVPVPNEHFYGYNNLLERFRLILVELAKLCLYLLILVFGKVKPWRELVAAR